MTSDNFFEKLHKHYSDQLPFVAYRKPKETILNTLLQKDATLHSVTDFTECGFVLAPFDSHEKSVLIPMDHSDKIQCDSIISHPNESSQLELKSIQDQQTIHVKLVEKAIEEIKVKNLKKVVVSRSESISVSDSDPMRIFKNLLHTYPAAFVYFFYHPNVGLWLGATPETLLKIEGNRLNTMALAGTQKYKGTENVEWKDKEREEQQIVTEFIVDSLQQASDQVSVSEVKTVKAGNLLHLQTNISAQLNPKHSNLQLLLKNIHPTPAVCGIPRDEAIKFILNNENYNREFYTGFLGELNLWEKKSRNSNRRNVENDAYASVKKTTNLYVNLRCMQLKANQAILYVGGGITKDSIPKNEWEETVSKSEVIKSIL